MKISHQVPTILALTLLLAFVSGCDSSKTAANSVAPTAAAAGKSQTADLLTAPEITVYKSPTCGCCDDWVDHLREEGFNVITQDRDNMQPVKKSAGVPEHLQSCHTAMVDGYVIEGHVPAEDIKRLLAEKPAIAGLTAPGMPMQSPGMQEPGLPPKGYDVLSFDKRGKTAPFTRY